MLNSRNRLFQFEAIGKFGLKAFQWTPFEVETLKVDSEIADRDF